MISKLAFVIGKLKLNKHFNQILTCFNSDTEVKGQDMDYVTHKNLDFIHNLSKAINTSK